MHCSETLHLAQQLIARPSITPHDAGCQSLIADHLTQMGFQVTELPFGPVTNLWAQWGCQRPLCVFAGHTDVVPTGPLSAWDSPPFEPSIRSGYLYGRGAADMKSSLAAMVVASKHMLQQHPHFKGAIGFLITSDEEGPAIHGTQAVIEYLRAKGIHIDYCLVGEPTSQDQLGDTLKIGRRGSLNGTLTIQGKQGHIAYPQYAKNPIHLAMPILQALQDQVWDEGHPHFEATQWQCASIQAGTGATNVIPDQLMAQMNWRYGPSSSAASLKNKLTAVVNKFQVPYHMEWAPPNHPFITQPGKLTAACQQAIAQQLSLQATLSTNGGTSDARFISKTGCEVIEFGPVNATIHQANECISLTSLEQLTSIYTQVLRQLLKA